ncbi:MAG: amidohydrolase family protein [bacterium]|nr:amidohydrolase family protein [bacterium]
MNHTSIIGNAWLGGAQVVPVRIRIEQGRISSVERGVYQSDSVDTLVLSSDEILLPGFHDAHLHLITGGLQMAQIEFSGARTVDAILERISDYISKNKPAQGQWIQGHGIEQTEVTITRTDLDRATADYPFFTWTHDLHSAVANSKALVEARVDGLIKNPEGGTFERGGDGKLNGVLREKAAIFVADQIPEPTEHEFREAFLRAQLHALARNYLRQRKRPPRLARCLPERWRFC